MKAGAIQCVTWLGGVADPVITWGSVVAAIAIWWPAVVSSLSNTLEGMTVVATKDAILVVPKGRSQEVKKAVEALKERGREGLL